MSRHRWLVGGSAVVFLLSLPPLALAQCGGTERWPVKVGADPEAAKVDLLHPLPTSLHDLVLMVRPQIPNDDTTRVPDERVVRVVEGRLVKFKRESGKTGDSDYHLVISDDTLQYSGGGANSTVSPHSFIAEIADPACVGGRDGDPKTLSAFQDRLKAVRQAFDQQFPTVTGGWNDAQGMRVRLTGVTFFDRPHGQVGRASSGLELHPVLEILFTPEAGGGTPALPLVNGDFESGETGWTASSGVISTDSREPAHAGQGKAWLGGYGEPHQDTVWQQIAIPASAQTVTLQFSLHISTEEQGQDAYDKLRVRVRKADGTFIKTLRTYSNLQARAGFSLETVDLSAYRGQTVRIEWASQEDNGSATSFVIDDVRIIAQ
jgi:hypothetical protein